jgi:hypothetical protein
VYSAMFHIAQANSSQYAMRLRASAANGWPKLIDVVIISCTIVDKND